MGVGMGLFLLGESGYSPSIDQGASAVMILRVLYSLVPCLCNVLAIVIISFYPISEQKHAQIRKKIEASERLSGIT
jgi:Na+/melibiose symporter-like transporter